jgi:hypothetical protein
MTPDDSPYFDKDQNLNSPPGSHEKLPYSSVAEQAHAPLANTDDLTLFLRTSAKQVRRLVRPAYARFKELSEKVEPDAKPDPAQRDPRILRDTEHDMRMPPYMRDSDATPLSLNRRQYEFLMKTVDRLQPAAGEKSATLPFGSSRAQDHVSRVAKRISAKSPKRKTQGAEARKAKQPKGTALQKGRK